MNSEACGLKKLAVKQADGLQQPVLICIHGIAVSTEKFDLIIFGATSFVGKIICQHLCDLSDKSDENADPIRWAAAARSETKLQQLRN